MNQLISLLGKDGDELLRVTYLAESGEVFPDTARCHAHRLPQRMPRACLAYRKADPPSPELLSRVLEGLKRL
ncbi:MAG: hypothetical protein ACRDMI_16620 [Streptosporangiaceae bacterium]